MSSKMTHFPPFPLNNPILLFADNLFEILESLALIHRFEEISPNIRGYKICTVHLGEDRPSWEILSIKKVPLIVIFHAGKRSSFILLLSKMPDGLTWKINKVEINIQYTGTALVKNAKFNASDFLKKIARACHIKKTHSAAQEILTPPLPIPPGNGPRTLTSSQEASPPRSHLGNSGKINSWGNWPACRIRKRKHGRCAL